MIRPRYNFYAGTALTYTGIYQGAGIDEEGNVVDDELAYSNYQIPLSEGEHLYLNLYSLNSYNAIFFYDDTTFISSIKLSSVNNTVIKPPTNAKYWAVRFTSYDENFMRKRNTNFIYSVKPVNPHYKSLSKKYTKENGQEFFRESLDGKISLIGKDYEIVYSSKLEDELIFIIDKYSIQSKKWIEYYKGSFNKTDCKFNSDKNICEIKTVAIDDYNNVMNMYSNTYDIIKLEPEITKINLHKRSLMQVYVRGANSITNFFGGTYWEDDVNETIESHESLIDKYYFAYIKAGNEFYVSGAGISNVNSVYAGTNGYWQSNDKYRCEYVKVVSIGDFALSPGNKVYDINSKKNRIPSTEVDSGGSTVYSENLYKLRIIQNSDNSIVYESKWLFYSSLPYVNDNVYIDRNDIELVNVNNSADIATIKTTFVYHIYRRLLCDVDTVEYQGEIKNTYNLPIEDFVTDNKNYKKCIGLVGGMFFCTSKTVDEPTKYGINDYGKYFTNRFISSSVGIGRPLPISRNLWANASLWYVYDSLYTSFEKKLRKKYTLKNSWSIAAVIKALLNKIDPTLRHEATSEYSAFLYGSTMPISASRFYVYITQKTNILKGDYDQPAQKAEITLEDVMKMLRDCFRCYWYIENGKFKIEHISFFMKGGSYSGNDNAQLDFTKLTDPFNKKQSSYFQSEIEYEKSDLNNRYEFSWMDESTDLFDGVTIDVKSKYVQKDKSEQISINQFSSDIDFMLFNPNSFSNDGFALLCPIKSGSYLELPIVETQLIDENGDTYNAIVQNWYASWAYLTRFYLYDMPAQEIYCNVLGKLNVYGLKMCMKHDIEFHAYNDLNELQLIKTNIGHGKIDEFYVNIDTRLTKVKLAYWPR